MGNDTCLFCRIPREQILIDGPLAVAARDSYPVSKGHTLIIPRRHVASFFETTDEERQAMLKLLDEAKALLESEAATQTAQLEFLTKLQRILGEGLFVASYKYALLLALGELSVEKSIAPDGTLRITG